MKPSSVDTKLAVNVPGRGLRAAHADTSSFHSFVRGLAAHEAKNGGDVSGEIAGVSAAPSDALAQTLVIRNANSSGHFNPVGATDPPAASTSKAGPIDLGPSYCPISGGQLTVASETVPVVTLLGESRADTRENTLDGRSRTAAPGGCIKGPAPLSSSSSRKSDEPTVASRSPVTDAALTGGAPGKIAAAQPATDRVEFGSPPMALPERSVRVEAFSTSPRVARATAPGEPQALDHSMPAIRSAHLRTYLRPSSSLMTTSTRTALDDLGAVSARFAAEHQDAGAERRGHQRSETVSDAAASSAAVVSVTPAEVGPGFVSGSSAIADATDASPPSVGEAEAPTLGLATSATIPEQRLTPAPVKGLDLQIDSESVGPVGVKMRLAGGKLSLTIETSDLDGARTLESIRGGLTAALTTDHQTLDTLLIRAAETVAGDSRISGPDEKEDRHATELAEPRRALSEKRTGAASANRRPRGDMLV